MEEVDALASRLVIMAAGSACCLGTAQHLKSRFGDGYTLELRLGLTTTDGQMSGSHSSDEAGETAGKQEAGSWPADRHLPAEQSTTAELLSRATDRAQQHLESVLPGTTLLEKEPGWLLLRLPLGHSSARAGTAPMLQQHPQAVVVSSLSDVFEAVEAARESLGITEYSLAQSSLERVFLSMARAARHDKDDSG